jgi:hypothetical protein
MCLLSTLSTLRLLQLRDLSPTTGAAPYLPRTRPLRWHKHSTHGMTYLNRLTKSMQPLSPTLRVSVQCIREMLTAEPTRLTYEGVKPGPLRNAVV